MADRPVRHGAGRGRRLDLTRPDAVTTVEAASPRRLRLVAAIGLVAALLAPASAAAGAPPAGPSGPAPTTTRPRPPRYRPSAPIVPAATRACKSVLLVGDSVMGQVGVDVAATYRRAGYCARVDNEAVAGSAPAFLPGPGTWTKRLETLLRHRRWDVVVAFFQGNGAPANPDVLLHANERESLRMIDAAARAHVLIMWTFPMLSGTGCAWRSPVNRRGYEAYRQWVFTTLPGLRPGVVRVNANVLTPDAGPRARGPAGYTDRLVFRDGGTQAVRLDDCLHLAGRGPEVGAAEVVAATQELWAPCPGDLPTTVWCTLGRALHAPVR